MSSSLRGDVVRPPDRGIELWRFIPIGHAVVANDTDAPVAELAEVGGCRRCPPPRRLGIAPSHQQQQLSRIVDALENLTVDKSLDVSVEAKRCRQMLRCDFRLVAVRRSELGDRDRLRHRVRRLVEALLDDANAARRIAVVGHLANAQMVLLEDFEPPLFLDAVMLTLRAPAHYGLLITPCRQRQQAAFRPGAFEALVVDETVDRL